MTYNNFPKLWDEAVDVIVVGSGFAGLAAAIEAKNAGGSVIILEKMKGYGGNSTISDGVMAAAGTRLQEKVGIQDSPELMASDMMKAGLYLNHPDLVRTVAEHSVEAFQWTVDYLGVQYLDRVDQFGGHTVPRGHKTNKGAGAALVRQLLEKVKSLGVPIRTRTNLKKFVKDTENRVCGVLIQEGYEYPDRTSGTNKHIKAHKAVILATGGFGSDIGFRSAQDPRLSDAVSTTNKYSATSESLKEAMRIGAMPVHLSWIQLGPWATPDEKGYGVGADFAAYIALSYGIMVNPETGLRIVNEMGDRKLRCDAILHTGRPCIGLADSKGVEASGHSIDRALKRGIVKSFQNTEEISQAYNIPCQHLSDTIQKFNEAVVNKKDEQFGKPILGKAHPLNNPPFYCIRLWPKVHYTMGGILINPQAQVLDLENHPIKGFYAAGEVTGGVHGASRLGTCAITDCLVFGRIAGKNAVIDRNPTHQE